MKQNSSTKPNGFTPASPYRDGVGGRAGFALWSSLSFSNVESKLYGAHRRPRVT